MTCAGMEGNCGGAACSELLVPTVAACPCLARGENVGTLVVAGADESDLRQLAVG